MRIHFIGIGGIGVSALARYYLAKGDTVTGSDLTASEITKALEKLGANISIGKNTIKKDADLTIYSPAVKHPMLNENKHRVLSYPEALGELTKKYFTIAVSGTSGKSTVTAMLSLILIKAGLDPTVIIGTKLKEFGDANFRKGDSQYLVIEADEHMASFLNYWPKMIVITNIEPDHLDYYKTFGNVKKAFDKFISHLPKDGILIKMIGSPTSYHQDAKMLKKILKIPGEHNISNALAALTAARALKIPDKVSLKALSEYKGAWRRFETVKTKPYILISDYGHNPTKAMAALKAAREKYPRKSIWCVYQPHQYQRTFYLFKDFVRVFRQAPVEKLIITDIYDVAGREEKKIKNEVSSEKLVKAVDNPSVVYMPKNGLDEYLRKKMPDKGVLIIMGAGDIYNLALNLLK